MKARHIIICLALSLWGTGLQAQTDLPQVFSPNAAELGKYGRIPVSYFNGLPNISIPLTELRAKNYTLPIYLTYHASGNKPDQHPGWVGLGWTLHAGGCINRIVNGMKDEMVWSEIQDTYSTGMQGGILFPCNPGYFFRMHKVQSTDWSNGDTLKAIKMSPEHYFEDYYPDEFQICLEDIQASFYFVGENQVKIISKTNADFSVQYHINTEEDNLVLYPEGEGSLVMYTRQEKKYRAKLYHYIDELIVTNHDGTKYYFGGDQNSIEFSVSPRLQYDWNPVGTANTWMLTKIERPDGETITFSYSRSLYVPIVKSDYHRVENWYEPAGNNEINHQLTNTLEQTDGKQNLAFTFLMPVYLSAIDCSSTGDHLSFLSSPSSELGYDYSYPDFYKRAISCTLHDGPDAVNLSFDYIKSLDKFKCLRYITSSRDFEISFSYENQATERLRLSEVSFIEDNSAKKAYSMTYDPGRLPAYNSKQVDSWGYYNGITVGQSVADTSSVNERRQQVDTVLMKAEILTLLTYPTGGHTRFEYEAHRYGKIATQFPFGLVDSLGLAGGLRIKKLTDVDGNHEEERRFEYSYQGRPSGILSGVPLFRTSGFIIEERTTSLFGVPVFIDQDVTNRYEIYSESPLYRLSMTDGNNVTYSHVCEVRPDGSRIEYDYTNHDSDACGDELPAMRDETLSNTCLDDAFTSRQLVRGLPLSIKQYDSNGTLVQSEERSYSFAFNDHVRAVDIRYPCSGLIMRLSYIKLYSFYPKASRIIETIFPEGNSAPYTLTTDYTYDTHRRLTEVKRTSGDVVERDRYTYTGDYTNAPYSGMTQRNMVSLPVEHLHYRQDYQQPEKLVGAELVTWKSSGDFYVPAGKWSAGLGGTGVDAASFTVFSGTGKDSRYGNTPDLSYTHYDANGNLVLSEDRASRPTAYLWTPDGCRPAAIIPGASVPYVRRDSSDVPKSQVYNALTQGQTRVKDFECVAPFTLMLALMCPSGQNWFVEAYVDGERYPMTRINSSYTGGDWSGSGLGQYPFSLQIPLSGGAHSVRVRAGQNYHPDYATDVGCTFIINYREKRVTETTVPGPTVVFEDFEEDGNHTAEAFRSGKSRKGMWTHALNESFGPYWVDYRVFRNGRWNYVRQSASGSSVTISEGTAPIDHVRIYPMGSLPESYTWWPDGNLRSRTDAQGVTESYRYDGLGRLSGVYDNDGNKVEGYQYNYQNR